MASSHTVRLKWYCKMSACWIKSHALMSCICSYKHSYCRRIYTIDTAHNRRNRSESDDDCSACLLSQLFLLLSPQTHSLSFLPSCKQQDQISVVYVMGHATCFCVCLCVSVSVIVWPNMFFTICTRITAKAESKVISDSVWNKNTICELWAESIEHDLLR